MTLRRTARLLVPAWVVLVCGLLICGLSMPAGAQDFGPEFIAFGDSITRGDSRWDNQNRGGYPGRLNTKLEADNPAAKVFNFGRDSEITAEGLSRIDSVLGQAAGAETLLLMEGTNDVILVIEGAISFESIESNLSAIGTRAKNKGLNVINATIIPRPASATVDKNNHLTFAVVRAVRDLAFRKNNALVDPYDKFFFTPGVFQSLYSSSKPDAVGHPNAAGFAVMTDLFYDVISGLDTQGPVPGEMDPDYLEPNIGPAKDISLTIYDLESGIDPDNTTLTINGIAVDTEQDGNSRRRTLTHDTTKATLGCFARVGIRAMDLADPPNTSDHAYAEFKVNGGTIIKGDINKSCRVDGVDLLIVALAFGSQDGEARYSKAADLNNDGKVDGADFAALANNFGRSS